MSLIIFSCSILIFLISVYIWVNDRYKYWKRKGVISPPTVFPFGNIKDMVMRKKHMGEVFQELYIKYKKYPYIGVYMMTRRVLLVNDLNLTKRILTRDYPYFSGHGFPFDVDVEPIAGHLFNIDGEKWKYLRTKLNPTFTPSKIKMMFNIVNDCAKQLTAYLEKCIAYDNCVDVKDVFGIFSNDVIANCAFGIECNTFENPNDKFRRMGKRVFKPTVFEDFFVTFEFFFPKIINKLKPYFVKNDIEQFFYGLVKETMDYREKNGVVRNDFMQLLIQLKNTGRVSGDDDDKFECVKDDGTRLTMMQLAAQAFVFFIAGFETSSSASSFALYELALNPEIQEKVAEEIDQVLKKYDGNITYDSLFEMTYLTKVIEETMRKYPALPVHFRICTKDYMIPGTSTKIEKDTLTLMPIYGIHRDPDIYPNPEKFDPERFSPENRKYRHYYSYLPFGEGPRVCIGARFGMMQTKLGLVAFLSKFNVNICDKAPSSIVFDKKNLVLISDGGIWLEVKPRST